MRWAWKSEGGEILQAGRQRTERTVANRFENADRNFQKFLVRSTSLPVMGLKAGVNTASLGRCPHGSKTGGRVPQRTQRPRVETGERWAPQGCTLPLTHHEKTTNKKIIPARSQRLTRAVPSAVHKDKVSSMLLEHRPRLVEEATLPLAHGT